MEPFFCCVNKKLFFTQARFTQGEYNLNKQFINPCVNAGLQYSKARDVPRYEAKKMVRPRGMFTSFYQARKIAVTLLYKLKTVDLSCFDPEEKSLSKWQKTAI